MTVDVMDSYDVLSDYFNDESTLLDFFDSVQFKLNKNNYHFKNIELIIENVNKLNLDFTENIKFPLYFESESLLISLRSTVDMVLNLINYVFDLRLDPKEIHLGTVYHHNKLPLSVQKVFNKYTRPFNNPTWNFIYSLRNEIVHEKSIIQKIPLDLDLFLPEEPLVFLTIENKKREIRTFFSSCIDFLEMFVSQTLSILKIHFE